MNEWYPKAFRLDGPPAKHGYNGIYIRQHKGAIYHSMEGRWQDAYSRLMSSDKVSWHLSLTYGGVWLQHYALNDVLWHGGCTFAGMLAAIECEGRAGESLTRQQVNELAEFTAWLAEQEDWPEIKFPDPLWEHQMMVAYGAAPTACPSGRIPWEEVIEMATMIQDLAARLAAVEDHVPFANAVLAKHEERLGGLDAHNEFTDPVLASHEQRI
ncbi:MAG: N-acetylmuramoyl-L-alanine amidase, partial [Anaerolineales bacterium]|nr:N-acetylmuramoyl-L-alanine amidase [Anaerolineales bacterium]